MTRRTLVTIIICIAVAVFPYWVYIPALVLAILMFPFYWEGIIFAFLIDVLYGNLSHTGISFVFPFAIFASVLVLVLLPLREQIRFNA